jgi:LPS export ABC transporter protein LptC
MMKIFLLVLIFIFVSCKRQNPTESEMRKEILSSFILRNYKGSRLQWKLTAEDAKVSDTTVIHQFELEFFDKDLQPSSKLKADSGYVFNKTNDLKAMGHIVVRSKDSVTLWTDELNWSEDRQKIFTDGEVKYSKGNQIYRGKGLESDPDLKNIVIKEKFRGKVEFE